MSYPLKHLNEDESILIDRHPHWWFLVPRGLLLVVATVFGGWTLFNHDDWKKPGLVSALHWIALVVAVLAFLYFMMRLVRWLTTSFVITTKRCIYRVALFGNNEVEIPLSHINSVTLKQSAFERLLRAGDLAIESAGRDSQEYFTDIYDPAGVRKTIDRVRDSASGASARPAATLSVAEQLEKLADLRERGLLSDDEFESQKAALLAK